MKRTILFALFAGFIHFQPVHAQVFTLPQLTPSQIEPLFKTLAADLAYRPVEGAASMSGGITGLGFSLGVTAIGTTSKDIASIIGKDSLIPGAFIDFGVALPYGLGIEAGFVPDLKISGTTFGNFGGNIRWNFGHLVNFPFDMALRAMYTSSNLSFSQALSGADIAVSYKAKQMGANLTVGKTFGIIEPYVGLGWIKADSTLSYTGTVSLFGGSFPVGTNNVEGDNSSLWLRMGLQLRLLITSLGFEYDKMYDTSSYALKFAFRF